MKHVKKFDEFIADENPAADSEREPETKAAPAADTDTPAEDTADEPEAEPEKAEDTDTPASDQADDTNDEVEDEIEETAEMSESAFHSALHKAKLEGKEEFEFKGKTYKIGEKKKTNESVMDFEAYLSENFALYPSYNNMLGSEVLRNVPITHQVNQSVYGKDYVVDQSAPAEEPAVTVVVAEEK
jgi:hypothetical protein